MKQGRQDLARDIVMINGSPTDANAADFKDGAHSVLDAAATRSPPSSTPPTGAPTRPRPGWSSQIGAVNGEPHRCVRGQRRHRRRRHRGPQGGGVNPLPPVTGQDAELAAIQRILAGDQAHDHLQGHRAAGRPRREEGHRSWRTSSSSRHHRRQGRASPPPCSTRSSSPSTTSRTPSSPTTSTRSATSARRQYADGVRQAPASADHRHPAVPSPTLDEGVSRA